MAKDVQFSTVRAYLALTLLKEIFAPGPAFRDELERGCSNGERPRSQRGKQDLDLRHLGLCKAVNPNASGSEGEACLIAALKYERLASFLLALIRSGSVRNQNDWFPTYLS